MSVFFLTLLRAIQSKAVSLLGIALGLRLRPFGTTGVLILQIIVGTADFVIGLLMLMFYALHVSGGVVASRQLSSTFAIVLLPIALFSFVFGILSFAVSILAAGNQPRISSAYSQPSYSPSTSEESMFQPTQVSTQQYVAELQQTILQRTETWTERSCPQCGTLVSADANYCDSCGSVMDLGTRLNPRPTT